MKLSTEKIQEDMKAFATDIMKCQSVKEAQEIDKRLDEYFEKYDIPDELNILITEGYGEKLRMMLLASE